MKIEIPEYLNYSNLEINTTVLDFNTEMIKMIFGAIILFKTVILLLPLILKTNIIKEKEKPKLYKLIPILDIFTNIILFMGMAIFLDSIVVSLYLIIYTPMFIINVVKLFMEKDKNV